MNYNSFLMRVAKKFYILIIFFLVNSILLQAQKPASTKDTFSTAEIQQRKITYKIIDAPNKTYCYDIFIDGKLLIHQPSVPGMPGKQGFLIKSDAEKVAALVIKKVEKGIMPPTIDAKELDSLNVKY